MNGINYVTIFALLAGLVFHALKQFIPARRLNKGLTLRMYLIDGWPEAVAAVVGAGVLYLAVPELAALFPDVAKSVGFVGQQTVLSSFICGYFGNSLADILGKRVQKITGAPPEPTSPGESK